MAASRMGTPTNMGPRRSFSLLLCGDLDCNSATTGISGSDCISVRTGDDSWCSCPRRFLPVAEAPWTVNSTQAPCCLPIRDEGRALITRRSLLSRSPRLSPETWKNPTAAKPGSRPPASRRRDPGPAFPRNLRPRPSGYVSAAGWPQSRRRKKKQSIPRDPGRWDLPALPSERRALAS